MKILKKLVMKPREYKVKEIANLHFQYQKNGYPFLRNYHTISFNKIWSNALRNFDFYKLYAKQNNLPSFIKDINDLLFFPTISKKDIQDNLTSILCDAGYGTPLIRTGGSTGQPASFPIANSDQLNIWASLTYARRSLGISENLPIVLLWGSANKFVNQSHFNIFFGSSVRVIKDLLLNQTRILAYDISEEALFNAINIIESKPNAILIGYSSYIVRLAKFIGNNSKRDFKLRVNKVILTAEAVSELEIELVNKTFQCQCLLEYGAAEIGCISYSSQNNSRLYDVLWDSNLLLNRDGKVITTTINRSGFPLINYELGDLFDESQKEFHVLSHGLIRGRKNDSLSIKCKGGIKKIHSEIITHILRSDEDVFDFLVKQDKFLNIKVMIFGSNIQHSKMRFEKHLSSVIPDVVKDQFIFIKFSGRQMNELGKSKWISSDYV